MTCKDKEDVIGTHFGGKIIFILLNLLIFRESGFRSEINGIGFKPSSLSMC